MSDEKKPMDEIEHAIKKVCEKPEMQRISAALVRSEFERADLEDQLRAENNRAELLRREVLILKNRIENIKQDDTGELLWTYPDGQKCLKPHAKHRADWVRTYAAYALPAVYQRLYDGNTHSMVAEITAELAHETWDAVQRSLGEPTYTPDDGEQDG